MAGTASSSSKKVGSSVAPCPLQSCSILVQVLRADTGEFVREAKVAVDGPSPGEKPCSPGNGSAAFDPVKPGAYRVEVKLPKVQADEFEPAEAAETTVSPGSCAVVTILLRPLARLKVKVFAREKVDGRTKETVLANATVSVKGAAQLGDGQTGKADGVADFGMVKAGTYEITVHLASGDLKKFNDPISQRASLRSGEDLVVPVVVSPVELCWIAVEILEEDDSYTTAEMPYWIQLADGTVREGTFKDGHLRLEDIPCGQCLLKLPGIDEGDFVVAAHANVPEVEEPKNDWIEILVEDHGRVPLANAAYSLRLPDGTVEEGKLDAYGILRREGILAGQCEFTLTEYEGTDLEIVEKPAKSPK